ncbi:mrna turnover protein 4 [Ophiostoma piceae UAMH 11346]|uniref:Ribosome assembly factor mrt4 n=1 Tax=Ophiostoma piceae (strain UAMH 11346) TaxID=1262450 RepID=S3CA03_OPHP1|nr:mrna turnover protein 4 [Ophiostoma piceae UAMH 11346]
MPKSKREKLLHLSQVAKKTREHKDRLFANIRDAVPEYEYCFVVRVDNMRNQHLKDVRQEMTDSRLFLGKTKLMARALGTTPEDALAEGIDRLAARYLQGVVGLLFTNRKPADVRSYLESLSPVDFARAGTVSDRDVVIPRGVLHSTGGLVPEADDVPIGVALEPELRRLGMPVRLLRGKVVLEEAPVNEEGHVNDAADGYVICRKGQTLDARQTRLLRLFGICLSEFRIGVLAYWSSATSSVTELEAPPSRKPDGKGAVAAASSEDEALEDADEA